MDTVCRRFHIQGLVQGVFYRANTQKMAKQLNITGYANNLANGDVEVVACGDASSLDLLEKWLWQGPQKAKVTDVSREDIPFESFEDFTTGGKESKAI